MKKRLLIIGGIVLAIAIALVIVFSKKSATSKSNSSTKMVCKSNEGSITITYNDKEITNYKAVGIFFDFKEQKEYAQQIGLDKFLTEYAEWFKNNTTGTCSKQ